MKGGESGRRVERLRVVEKVVCVCGAKGGEGGICVGERYMCGSGRVVCGGEGGVWG